MLFVPLFTFNLLSICALNLSHNCSVNFLFDPCVIQDLTRGLMIGKGRIQENLYFLDLGIARCDSISSSCVRSNSDIWNFRWDIPLL